MPTRHQRRWLLSWCGVICLASVGISLVYGQPPVEEGPVEEVVPAWLPEEPIEISEETTRLLEPLGEDGYVDYVAALNQHYSEGVTPENNALVGIIRALGPGVLSEISMQEFCDDLGIETLPAEGDYFVGYGDFLDSLNLSPSAREKANAEFAALVEQVGCWSSQDYPHIAQWLAANETSLDAFVAASALPRFYCPLVIDAPRTHLRLHYMPFPTLNSELVSSGALTFRARLQAGLGNVDDALTDLIAGRRLARHVATGPYVLRFTVGYSMEAVVFKAEQDVLSSVTLTPEQAAVLRQSWENMPSFQPILECASNAQRYSALDMVIHFSLNGPEAMHNDPPDEMNEFFREADWNDILRRVNAQWDRMLEIAGDTDWDRRKDAFTQEMRAVAGGNIELTDIQDYFREREADPGEQVLEDYVVSQSIVFHLPNLNYLLMAEAETQARENIAIVVAALAEYHAQEGEYPPTLEALVPAHLPELPLDPFSGKQLEYSSSEAGFKLYSIGRNRTNEGGTVNDEPEQGDLVFSVGGG